MEKEIKIASKLYDIRDTTKKFYGEDYEHRVDIYKQLIKAVMTKHNLSASEALIKISGGNAYKDAGAGKMLFISGAVEIMIENEG